MTNKSRKLEYTYKFLSQIIKDNKNSNIEKYINYVKSLLYYVGKVSLSTLYLKYKGINLKQFKDIVFNNSLENLPEIFFDLESVFTSNKNISDEDKALIVTNIQKLNLEELEQICLGEMYQSFITSKERKYLGQVYTPKQIVIQMINEGINVEKIINNPYFKVIDPACGGGYFLIEAYKRIKEILLDNYDKILFKKPEMKEKLDRNIDSFIIENNLWGCDIDQFAVFMTTISILLKGKPNKNTKVNIYKLDFLLEGKSNIFDLIDYDRKQKNKDLSNIKFDLVIGNPPYIGHKKIDKNYRKELQNYYQDVYSDKSDISYCFFKKGYELLQDEGVLLYITSRYFLEAPSAKGLRKFIVSNFIIEFIVDFFGKKLFKGIGISPVIIKCIKEEFQKEKTNIYRFKDIKINAKKDIKIFVEELFNHYLIQSTGLSSEGWMLMNREEKELYEKIHNMGQINLNEICYCNQGIITGCDKAFIIDEETIKKENLDRTIIKSWIKNSGVKKYKMGKVEQYIIYTDLINDLKTYPNVLNHIAPFEDKLKKRRECQKGLRKWYQLQWGRRLEIFQGPKILFPFKAEANRFTIAYEEILCSADVYIMNLKNNLYGVSLEYLLAFLNSSLCEFYFKSVAKKVGEKMYEYYPNKVMSLNMRVGKEIKTIEQKVINITKLQQKNTECIEKTKVDDNVNNDIFGTIKDEIKFIDNYFYSLYELSEKQIRLIESTILNM